MQTKKADIQKTILEVAKKLLLEYGYQKTSMRAIAKEANVTLSNIYNYFKNKDEILEVILRPVLKDMEQLFKRYNDPYYITTNWVEVDDISEIDEFKEHVKFIIMYQKEFDLLLHKCSGSKYENIKDYFIDRYTESSRNYLQLMKDKYPQVNKEISDFFLHTTAAWWIQIVSEIVSHHLNKEEILQFLKEYMTFGSGGWQRLMNL
ncbi:MAG: TetR family transcriptional regulator [Ignavibacteriae bacterium]|nr:MAG: TetR family transcriptional regulator [Ignavibacteriota bacterium]